MEIKYEDNPRSTNFNHRMAHSCSVLTDKLFVFGGMLKNNEVSGELIIFQLVEDTENEKQIDQSRKICPGCNLVFSPKDWINYVPRLNFQHAASQQALSAIENSNQKYKKKKKKNQTPTPLLSIPDSVELGNQMEIEGK